MTAMNEGVHNRATALRPGFTLIELLVVIAIIATQYSYKINNFPALAYLAWEPDDNQVPPPPWNVYNDGANNPSTTPVGKEGVSRLHIKGAVVLGLDGRAEFMTLEQYWIQADRRKDRGGLIFIAPKYPSGAAGWISPQPR